MGCDNKTFLYIIQLCPAIGAVVHIQLNASQGHLLFRPISAKDAAYRLFVKANKDLIRTGKLFINAIAAEFLHIFASLSFHEYYGIFLS